MDNDYDVIIVGGGLGGAALGRSIASNGVRTLIIERDLRFRDRVRGEQLQPWGVAEARRLGIDGLLRSTCGHDHPWFDTTLGGVFLAHRDLRQTTPQATPGMTFFHPAMQEVLLEAARDAGAEVRRGAMMRSLTVNGHVRVGIQTDETTEEVTARLVVGADGRNSLVRRSAGFPLHRDPPYQLIAGVLAERMQADDGTAMVYLNPTAAKAAAIFPQGGGRARIYAIYPGTVGYRLQGVTDLPRFVDEVVAAGVPRAYFEGVRFSGPLASFDAADSWVTHPYRDQVALIGDAAAANTPSWGQGLCLTLRDARVLAENLLATDRWDEAADEYAREHDRYYDVLHDVTATMTDVLMRADAAAEERRARALPRIQEDPTRVPDHTFCGPDLPWNADLKSRFLGES